MAHINEKLDFAVEVLVVYQNRVLLRMHDKYDQWLGVGGHIDLGEDPNQAAIREVKEEIGLDVKLVPAKNQITIALPNYTELIPPRYLNRHRINEDHEHVGLWYFATSSSDQITQGQTERSEECRWFTMEELQNLKEDVRDAVVLYAKAALEELSE